MDDKPDVNPQFNRFLMCANLANDIEEQYMDNCPPYTVKFTALKEYQDRIENLEDRLRHAYESLSLSDRQKVDQAYKEIAAAKKESKGLLKCHGNFIAFLRDFKSSSKEERKVVRKMVKILELTDTYERVAIKVKYPIH